MVMHGLTWWSCMTLLDGHAWSYLMVLHGLTWWSCMALLDGHAWLYLMVMHGLTLMVMHGGPAWPYLMVLHGRTWWSCMALLDGHAWPYLMVLHGFTWWSCIMASFQEPTVLLTVLQGKQANLLYSKALLFTHKQYKFLCIWMACTVRFSFSMYLPYLRSAIMTSQTIITWCHRCHYYANKPSASKNFSYSNYLLAIRFVDNTASIQLRASLQLIWSPQQPGSRSTALCKVSNCVLPRENYRTLTPCT